MKRASFFSLPEKPYLVWPIIFLGWGAFILISYFGPLRTDPFSLIRSAFTWSGKEDLIDLEPWLRFIRILFSTGAVLWVTLRLGNTLGGVLGSRFLEGGIRRCAEFSLGVSGFSLLWLGLGLVRLWYGPLLIGTFAVLFVLSFFIKKSPAEKLVVPWREVSWPLGLISVLFSIFSVIHGCLPETHPDGLVYHLGTLSFWLFSHGLIDLPFQPMAHFPYGGEMYFFSGFLWGGTEPVKCLNLAALFFLAWGAAGWVEEKVGSSGKWMTFAMVLTLPLFHLVAWTAQVEVLQCLFLLLFFYGLDRMAFKGPRSEGLGLLTGLWGAMALSIKTTSIFGVVAGVIALFVVSPDWRSKQGGRWMGKFLLAFLFLVLPWLIKNWSYDRNPFYPWLMDWFPGRRMSPEGYRFMLSEAGSSIPGGRLGWTLPWHLFMSKPALFDFCGPLPLIFLPLWFMGFDRGSRTRFLTVSVFSMWLLGLATTWTLKFHLPAVLLSYILVGTLLGNAGKGTWGKIGSALILATGLLCFPYLAGMSGIYFSGGGIWSGHETPEAYLKRMVKNPYVDLCAYAGSSLPPGSRLLIVGDARGLYYPRLFYTETGYDVPLLARLAMVDPDPETICKGIKRMGVTHVIVNVPQGITACSSFSAYPLDREKWRGLDDFFNRGLDPLYSDGWRFVFGVRDRLRERPEVGRMDPVLFFSEPVVRFLGSKMAGDRTGSAKARKEISQLYPFPNEWEADEIFLKKQGFE